MITQEKYHEMRADFIKTYGEVLCAESLKDIESANDAGEFIDVLHKYSVFNNYKPFPDVDWARKWFAGEHEFINAHGCYLDQKVAIDDLQGNMIIFGDCYITCRILKPQIYHIILQDTATLNLLIYGTAVVYVKQKGESNVQVIWKDRYSRLKIRKYETKNEPQWR